MKPTISGLSVWLGIAVLAACSPPFQLPSGQIAYEEGDVVNRVSTSRIALMELPSRRTRYVTPASLFALAPSWSADGKRLAFYSLENGNEVVWTVDVATGKLQRVTMGGQPVWASDGNRILYRRPRSLWIIDLGGGPEEQLMQGEDLVDYTPSPDGQYIAYRPNTHTLGSEVKFLNLKTHISTSTGISIECLVPLQWRSDSKQVYCLGWARQGDSQIVNRVNLDGTYTQEPASFPEPTGLSDADVSPDGKSLMYTICSDAVKFSTCELWIVEIASGRVYRLTNDQLFQGSPRWSPVSATGP